MQDSLTLNGKLGRRTLSFLSGAGMMVASAFTIRHFFAANYPESIFAGSICDINAFFNCDSSAYSVISQIAGVPLGYFGLFVGGLVSLGALFPSAGFERTNKSIALLNLLGVISLFLFSVFYLGSLCLFCAGFYLFSIASFLLFWKWGIDNDRRNWISRYVRPSPKHAVTFALVMLLGAYPVFLYHDARKGAQEGVAMRVVSEYYSLPQVPSPSIISPFMTVQSTEKFEDAPIQLIEYADFLCPDCLYLTEQLSKLKEEFKGKINIAFQFFPLDQCNDVVEQKRSLHPGACEIAYIAAYDQGKFRQMHDEIFANFRAARSPQWRRELAKRYQAEAALNDQKTKDLVHSIMRTGAEYERTSDKFAYGIRSTPTMILNNRMVIGTLPYIQLRTIFRALVQEREGGGERKFMENWVPPKRRAR